MQVRECCVAVQSRSNCKRHARAFNSAEPGCGPFYSVTRACFRHLEKRHDARYRAVGSMRPRDHDGRGSQAPCRTWTASWILMVRTGNRPPAVVAGHVEDLLTRWRRCNRGLGLRDEAGRQTMPHSGCWPRNECLDPPRIFAGRELTIAGMEDELATMGSRSAAPVPVHSLELRLHRGPLSRDHERQSPAR